MKLKIQQKFGSCSVKVSGECAILEESYPREALSPLLAELQQEVVNILSSDDYNWWIEAIKDEVERAGYKLVKEE
jgi:hypothetical protein